MRQKFKLLFQLICQFNLCLSCSRSVLVSCKADTYLSRSQNFHQTFHALFEYPRHEYISDLPAGINLSLSFVSPHFFLHIYNSALLLVRYFTYLGLFSPTISTTIHCKIWQIAKILKNTNRLLTEGNSLNYYRKEKEGWHMFMISILPLWF